MTVTDLRLTSLAHGGGCGCKLAPAVLEQILRKMPAAAACADLLVGIETGDDAAVYRLNDSQAIVATTDFFTPIVDDPTDFGRIAATNALSDIYAMGASPILALAIVGMPLGKIPLEAVQDILAGGASVCAAAGIPLAGGHSIDSPEPIYGLVVLGIVHPDRVLRNSGARPGDRLVLTKGLGIGIYGAALKKGLLGPELYAAMLASATQLNVVGRELPDIAGVHAVTDVTGFGLLGHTLEMCRGSGLSAMLRSDGIPVLPEVERLAQGGVGTGAAARNWSSYGHDVAVPDDIPSWRRDLLCDPQTSGGLLVAVEPQAVPALMLRLEQQGYERAAVIGELAPGRSEVVVV